MAVQVRVHVFLIAVIILSLFIHKVSCESSSNNRRNGLPALPNFSKKGRKGAIATSSSKNSTSSDNEQKAVDSRKDTVSSKTPLNMLKQLLDEIEDPDIYELDQVEGILNQRLNDSVRLDQRQQNISDFNSSQSSFTNQNQQTRQRNEKANEINKAKAALSFLKSQSMSSMNSIPEYPLDQIMLRMSTLSTNYDISPIVEKVNPSVLMKENVHSLFRVAFIVIIGVLLSFLSSVPSDFLSKVMMKVSTEMSFRYSLNPLEFEGEMQELTSQEKLEKYWNKVMFLIEKGSLFVHIFKDSLSLDVQLKWAKMLSLLLATLSPSVLFSYLLFDRTKFSVNGYIKVLHQSFTQGFVFSIIYQVLAATGVRLLTYKYFQPEVFEELKTVPLHVLPWVLKDYKFEINKPTYFISEFLIDCLFSPFIEEFMKLWIVLKSGVLPLRGTQLAKYSSMHMYLGYLMAAGTGMKLADNFRRVCLYSKVWYEQKAFFAISRGLFPVHELCAALTALELAKRNMLGSHISLIKLVLPATFLHACGNFRGKKPLFKFTSHAPWIEMQLQTWATDHESPVKMILNGFLGMSWLVMLSQYVIRICKDYFQIVQSQKRLLRMEQYKAWNSFMAAATTPTANEDATPLLSRNNTVD